MGVTLDRQLSCVETRPDGRVRVIASVDKFPTTEEERRLIQSAVHCVVLDEFREINPWALDVQVIVPVPLDDGDFAPSRDRVLDTTMRASRWIGREAWGVQSWARVAAISLFQGGADRILTTYPWRDAVAMRARLPILIDGLSRLMLDDPRDPTRLAVGYIDELLPSLKTVLKTADIQDVVRNVTASNDGQQPSTTLELYELVYDMVVSNTPDLAIPTINLHYALFLTAP